MRRRSRPVAKPAVACREKSVLLGVHGRQMHEGLDGLGILPAYEMCLAEVAPEARRMMRVQSHGLANPLNSLLRAPQPGEKLSHLNHDQVVVGVEGQRPILVVPR